MLPGKIAFGKLDVTCFPVIPNASCYTSGWPVSNLDTRNHWSIWWSFVLIAKFPPHMDHVEIMFGLGPVSCLLQACFPHTTQHVADSAVRSCVHCLPTITLLFQRAQDRDPGPLLPAHDPADRGGRQGLVLLGQTQGSTTTLWNAFKFTYMKWFGKIYGFLFMCICGFLA